MRNYAGSANVLIDSMYLVNTSNHYNYYRSVDSLSNRYSVLNNVSILFCFTVIVTDYQHMNQETREVPAPSVYTRLTKEDMEKSRINITGK